MFRAAVKLPELTQLAQVIVMLNRQSH